MSSKEEKNESTPSFNLTSASSLFSSRSNDVFGNLEVLEQKHLAHQKTQASSKTLESDGVIKHDPCEEDEGKRPDRENNDYKNTHSMIHYRKRPDQRKNCHGPHHKSRRNDSERKFPRDGFRRPGLPPRSRKVPDFKKHPDKWTSYSLEDVSENDMSERGIKRAALNFLFERKQERERAERVAAGLPAEEEKFESDTAACSKGLFSFSRKKFKKEKSMEMHDSSTVASRESFQEMFNDLPDANGDGRMSEGLSRLEDDVTGGIVSNSDSGLVDDDRQQSDNPESFLKFKSRKNVRKHIRKRNDDDAEEA